MKRKWKLILAGDVLAAVTAAVTATALLAGHSQGTMTSHGSIELLAMPLSGLSAQEAYPDVTPGAQVTVVNSAGDVIATGTLAQGPQSTGLLSADYLNFTVTVPAGLPRYGIGVAGRGTVWESAAQMKAGPALSLGG